MRRSSGQRLPVQTVYLGGGTPSLIPAADIVLLMKNIREHFSLTPQVEITMEANPGTVSYVELQEIRRCGVNRLSLGMQAGQDRLLSVLGRVHSLAEVDDAVEAARRAGFTQLNLDLIYGIPTQSMADWEESLRRALAYHPEHLSLYALTLDEGLPMERRIQRGELPPPDDDLAAQMYERAEEILGGAGYEHYEISNWARVDGTHAHRCRHNQQYWENGNYLGIGAGAHGCIDGVRVANTAAVEDYITRLASRSDDAFPLSPATVTTQELSREDVMAETMFLGLRLTEDGVSNMRFRQRFGVPFDQVYSGQIEGLLSKGLIERIIHDKDVRLRLTKKGRLLGNQVFMEFV